MLYKMEWEQAKEKWCNYYDADKVILGKKMSEHLPFTMAWWQHMQKFSTLVLR